MSEKKAAEEKKVVSRRQFVAGTVGGLVVGAAAGAAAGALGFPSAVTETVTTTATVQAKPWLPEKWDYEYDVVVAGAGGAGLSAAIEASDKGAKVVVLEGMPKAGGSTGLSGGMAAAPKKDRVGDAIKYWMACGKGLVDLDMVTAWAQEAVNIHDWLGSFGKITISTRPGYHTLYGGDYVYGADSLDSATPEGGAGPEMIDMLVKAAVGKGVEFLYETKAKELVRDPKTNEILGVKADSKGKEVYVKAGRGVVLACGGFGYNERMKLDHLRAWPKYDVGNPGRTGDGILMGLAVGASEWKMPELCGNLGYKFPEYDRAYPSMFQLLASPGVIVNRYGKRFAREDLSYDAFHQALDKYDSTKDEFTNIPCYCIFDEDVRAAGPIAYAPSPRAISAAGEPLWSADNSAEIARGWITKADTIKELATKIGIDPAALDDTVTKFNAYSSKGADAEFGRELGLKPIQKPSFYAVKAYPCFWDTFGSLKIDTRSRVIATDGGNIPRLYAAGANAIGALGFHYPSGGNAICDGLVFGRIAGRNAAAEKSWE